MSSIPVHGALNPQYLVNQDLIKAHLSYCINISTVKSAAWFPAGKVACFQINIKHLSCIMKNHWTALVTRVLHCSLNAYSYRNHTYHSMCPTGMDTHTTHTKAVISNGVINGGTERNTAGASGSYRLIQTVPEQADTQTHTYFSLLRGSLPSVSAGMCVYF